MNKKFLISIPTYKESENIEKLIKKIFSLVKNIKILIINDFSDDDTKNIIKKFGNKVELIERPKKLGLGTAHILSMLYAIKNKYKFLITMDADFSHDPKYLNSLIKYAGKNNFVIGSRFYKNGKSDYTGLRKYISILGNFIAKKFLNINCNELTTYFRVYSVNNLKKLPYNYLNVEGYSLGVRTIWMLSKLQSNLIEIPIHFKDRNKGKSKIPKLQIITSMLDLFYMRFNDSLIKNKFFNNKNYSYSLKINCSKCKNNNIFSLIKKNVYKCLVCGKNRIK